MHKLVAPSSRKINISLIVFQLKSSLFDFLAAISYMRVPQIELIIIQWINNRLITNHPKSNQEGKKGRVDTLDFCSETLCPDFPNFVQQLKHTKKNPNQDFFPSSDKTSNFTVKGVSFKPSGKMMVVPKFCFLS